MKKIEKKHKISLDEKERLSLMPISSPFEGNFVDISSVNLSETLIDVKSPNAISLNGEWQMAEGGYSINRKRPNEIWDDAIRYTVPGSIHYSLFENGLIPDPYIGLNDKLARENSYKVWWVKKEFDYDFSFDNPQICFDGVCYSAMFYLNGVYLGHHRGMFSQIIFSVKDIIQEHNVLVIKIDDAPALPRAYSDDADFDDGWKFGTVINCVYGWHYACIPSRGVWAPVSLRETPQTQCQRPFFSTVDAFSGKMDFSMVAEKGRQGTVQIIITPENFEGETIIFSNEFDTKDDEKIHYRFDITNPKLWWPNNCGDQNLYRATVIFAPLGETPQKFEELFGIRTVRMTSGAYEEQEDAYNWQLVINEEEVFIKGANWCTIDALLNFEKSNYERLLKLAKEQNINLLRSWGCGMPELDYFYELCDKLGIMVMQEWPTAWDSDKTQPYDEMHDTVEQNTIRIRNHPSLVMYGGGNESNEADSPVMTDMMRLSYLLDGTRPFHRTSPYGIGSTHSYTTYWYMNGVDASLKLDDRVLFEFGMASAPNVDSIMRYLPDEEKNLWDLRGKHNSFVHHMPRFNQHLDWPYGLNDVDHMTKYLNEFYDEENLEHFVTGTQLAQATIFKHPIENFRSKAPYSSGISYYKYNDVYPACSWATVDYYGAPKMSYYIVKNAYQPLHACLPTESISISQSTVLPVYLLNDNLSDVDEVCVEVYDSDLSMIYRNTYSANERKKVAKLGELSFEYLKNDGAILINVNVLNGGCCVSSTFYWFNYRENSGCLFKLPQGKLNLNTLSNHTVSIENVGDVPCVGVMVDRPNMNDTFEVSDGAFWLGVGESKILKVNSVEGLRLRAWNYKWE